ncbi:PAAR domain-containing protein [Caballeronia sp. Lep1P3]|uniref:PAAR domain-containing protein n=1 Tax=Caballeronia sp. Lep1P3 TaxID=2878150 RepID=UPI001FD5422A|nr:PAAR domain-containing protein [Caballeronia sp. Lep1P3]
MMRRIAVVGDKLDNDGEICSYDGPQFLVHGHQVALIDGAAYCPVCKTTGYIAKDGGPRRMNFFTSEIAAHDDVVVCGCSEHPRIFAMLAGEAWYDDMAESLGAKSQSAANAANSAATTDTAKHVGGEGKHTSWFYVQDSVTGEPLCNQSFVARVAGIERFGKTDASGYAKIDTDGESIIDLHVVFSSPKRELKPGTRA